MIVSDVAVKNRTSVVILALIIIFFGVWCYNELPRESSPDITIPNVFVVTDYKGVSATEMETGVTIHIEKKLKGLDRVKKIQSVSSEGLSQINIEFIPGTDIDEVLQKVKDKVDEAKGDLPVDLENDPSVFEVNISELPIVIYSMSGTCGIVCLKKLADDLADNIEAIPGVLEVNVTGGREREVRIEVDPEKLAYYQIPITRFQQVVASENQNTSGGAITLGDGRFQLRVPGEFSSPEEISGLVIASPGGRPVYLKDVARIVDGLEDETSRSRLNGREAVNIAIKKRVGENIIGITDQITALIERESQTWPKGTIFEQTDGSGQGYPQHGGRSGKQHHHRVDSGGGSTAFCSGDPQRDFSQHVDPVLHVFGLYGVVCLGYHPQYGGAVFPHFGIGDAGG